MHQMHSRCIVVILPTQEIDVIFIWQMGYLRLREILGHKIHIRTGTQSFYYFLNGQTHYSMIRICYYIILSHLLGVVCSLMWFTFSLPLFSNNVITGVQCLHDSTATSGQF